MFNSKTAAVESELNLISCAKKHISNEIMKRNTLIIFIFPLSI
ncbi:hypothetical protein ASZ90_004442 [hydrocarbon metagenome]|uniref:Uncharacterized protein n=1 Tax=hydrocarbon metagenome TaxID=938273 RepID=A0A0W8FXU2_9ZZZZ